MYNLHCISSSRWPSLPGIVAVTFDLWQTLLMDNQELGRARMHVRLDGALEILEQLGEDFSKEQVQDAYRQCFRTCHDIRAEGQDVSFMEQVEYFIGYIEGGLLDRLPGKEVGRIASIYADSFFQYPPVPHQDALKVLSQTKRAGYRIGLISNTGMTPGATFRAYLKQIGMLDYFDVLVFSDEVKLAKPSPQIFLRTLRDLKAEPEQTVHVGDHLLNDVLGANKVGMKTVWIETYEERRQEVDIKPDITVASLGEVNTAIESLAQSST